MNLRIRNRSRRHDAWQVERFQRSQIQAITILAGGRDGLTRLVRCI